MAQQKKKKKAHIFFFFFLKEVFSIFNSLKYFEYETVVKYSYVLVPPC